VKRRASQMLQGWRLGRFAFEDLDLWVSDRACVRRTRRKWSGGLGEETSKRFRWERGCSVGVVVS
jgi:hypothetical protein